MTPTGKPLAVLMSGGLDSAILLGQSLDPFASVYPLYVRCGLHWEGVELGYLKRFLASLARPSLQSLKILEQPLADLYVGHWSFTGENVPSRDDPDEAVFLPGRNVWLLTKALLWCHLHGIPKLALGSLSTNPFPDATPTFFREIQHVVNRAVEGSVQIELPFTGMTKIEVMRLGRGLPLELTFSCIHPMDGIHCGRCNKCGERQHAFADADLPDPTCYARP